MQGPPGYDRTGYRRERDNTGLRRSAARYFRPLHSVYGPARTHHHYAVERNVRISTVLQSAITTGTLLLLAKLLITFEIDKIMRGGRHEMNTR